MKIKMGKRFAKSLTALLTAVCVLGTAMSGVAAPARQEQVVSLLSELNIMKGDPDGNFRLDDSVSRAEFTKIVVASSSSRNSVASGLTIAPFKDVGYSHWAAPYIKLAVSKGFCKGYPDGTFDPDGQVRYEEAITMLLKVLGYTDEDFGVSWPYGQVGMADNLEITENVRRQIGDTLTRRDVSTLVYNTLDTKNKVTGKKQIGDFDCEIKENILLIATNQEDSSVAFDKVFTSAGAYEIGASFDAGLIGRKGDAVVKEGDKLLSFAPYEQQAASYHVDSIVGSDLVLDGKVLRLEEELPVYYKSQKLAYKNMVDVAQAGDTFVTFTTRDGKLDYAMLKSTHDQMGDVELGAMENFVVYAQLGNKIVAYKNGTPVELDLPDSTKAYKDKRQTTYAAIKADLAMGDILYVKRNKDGEIDSVSYEKGSVDGPVTVRSDTWYEQFGADVDNTVVMRNGNKASLKDVQRLDVAYYCKELNMLLTYSNKITGIYEKALPNKDMPTSVVVSGITYSLEGMNAFHALSSSGSFELGDTVTLLFGKDNKVADAVSPGDGALGLVAGLVTGTGTKEVIRSDNTRYMPFFIRVALPDGNAVEYITDRDYDRLVNSVVSVTFANGIARPNEVKGTASVNGTFHWADKTLGDNPVAKDVAILDAVNLGKDDTAQYAKVFGQRIDGTPLSGSDIRYVGFNERGEIKELILNDVTGDAGQYGMLVKAANKSSMAALSGDYQVDVKGKPYRFITSNETYSVYTGQAVRLRMNAAGQLESIQAISRINSVIGDITYTELEADGRRYPISDKVTVYQKTADNDYMVMALQDLIRDRKAYRISAFTDKAGAAGKRVRIIVAE